MSANDAGGKAKTETSEKDFVSFFSLIAQIAPAAERKLLLRQALYYHVHGAWLPDPACPTKAEVALFPAERCWVCCRGRN